MWKKLRKKEKYTERWEEGENQHKQENLDLNRKVYLRSTFKLFIYKIYIINRSKLNYYL